MHLSSSSLLADIGVGKRTFSSPVAAIWGRELTILGEIVEERRSTARAGIPSSKMGKAVRTIQNGTSIDLLRVWGIEMAILCRSSPTRDILPFEIFKFILPIFFQKRSYLFIQSDEICVWTIYSGERCHFVTS